MPAPSILITSYASTKYIGEGKLLASKIEKETGIKYVNTYTTILSFGDYDAEDWWVVPDWASLDKLRDCNALAEWILNTWDMIDQTRPQKSRMMRTVSEVKTIEKPEKWTELL